MSDTAPVAVAWPRRMRREQAARYLQEVHGIPLEPRTLANRNASGLGPKPEYFGTIPYYRPEVLDQFAVTCFTPESPVTLTRRRTAEAEARHSAAAPARRRAEAARRRQPGISGTPELSPTA